MLLKNKKGIGGTLAFALFFVIVICFNTATLYGLFMHFCSLTGMQLEAGQGFRYADFIIDRGIWLIQNEYQPVPYSGSYSDNAFPVQTLDGVVTGSLQINCITAGTGYGDSQYEISVRFHDKIYKLTYDNDKRILLE